MVIQVLIQAVVSIAALFLLAKWIGYRQISEMSMFDYINGITIGSIAAELAVSDVEWWKPFTAMILYAAATVFLSWLSDKSLILRRFIVGRPYVIYRDGTFLYENMRKNKIDLFEFMAASRGAGYFDLSQIETAILESNGNISFLPKAEHRPLTPNDMELQPEKAYVYANVILEGRLMPENLRHMGRDENWLNSQMQSHGIKSMDEVFLAICDGNDNCYFFRKDADKHPKDMLV